MNDEDPYEVGISRMILYSDIEIDSSVNYSTTTPKKPNFGLRKVAKVHQLASTKYEASTCARVGGEVLHR